MFDYSILHWGTFLTAAILLNLSPGPDIAFILGQTAKGGSKAGFAAMYGIWTGAEAVL
jgi:threonine/homoserine/homoserine lactone efflux protein